MLPNHYCLLLLKSDHLNKVMLVSIVAAQINVVSTIAMHVYSTSNMRPELSGLKEIRGWWRKTVLISIYSTTEIRSKKIFSISFQSQIFSAPRNQHTSEGR